MMGRLSSSPSECSICMMGLVEAVLSISSVAANGGGLMPGMADSVLGITSV